MTIAATREAVAFEEVYQAQETLSERVVAIADRLQNPNDPLYKGFREYVGVAVTPLYETSSVPVSGHTLLLKDETVHPCRAYKVRGATAGVLMALEENHDLESVVCASAGNHAKGLLQAANTIGLHCSVHVSSSASERKQRDLLDGGAMVHNEHESLADALVAAELEAEEDEFGNTAFVHPFDQVEVMAGQATLMQETLQQLEAAGYNLLTDEVHLVLPGGGLGMAAGSASWLAHEREIGRVGDAVKLTIVEVENKSELFWCDGTATEDGALTREILDSLSTQVDFISVTDVEVAQAMHELTAVTHKRIEPAGALATAGVKKLASSFPKSVVGADGTMQYQPSKTFVSVVSGANVSDETYEHATKLRFDAYQKKMRELAALVIFESVEDYLDSTTVNVTNRSFRIAGGW